MSKWEVTTTQAAIDRLAKIQARGSEHFYQYQASKEDRIEINALVMALRKFYTEAEEGIGESFREIIDVAYPIWRDQIVHERTPSFLTFLEWIGRTDRSQAIEDKAARVLGTFFNSTIDQSEAVVENWILRIESLIRSTKTSYWIFPRFYDTSFDMEDLGEFAKTNYQFSEMAEGLELGFTVAELKKLKPYFFRVNFTPTDLRSIIDRHSYRAINSLVSTFGLSSTRLTSFDNFVAALDAGFTSDKEFKAFARNTGVDYGDVDMFPKVTKMRTKVTDDEAKILTQFKPNMLELAKILIKL